MIVLGLAVLAIVLSTIERTLYVKKDKSWSRARFFIGGVLLCTLFLISYYATDTASGLVYVLGTVLAIVVTGLVDSKDNYGRVKLVINTLKIPFVVYLMIMTLKNSLINANYIFMLSIVISWILSGSHTQRKSLKEAISIGTGFVLAFAVLFFYYKTYDLGKDSFSSKQEFVAKDFLEKELNVKGFEVYSSDYFGSIRGKEIALNAYDFDGNFVTMVYKENEIIDYDLKTITSP